MSLRVSEFGDRMLELKSPMTTIPLQWLEASSSILPRSFTSDESALGGP